MFGLNVVFGVLLKFVDGFAHAGVPSLLNHLTELNGVGVYGEEEF